jgi:CheY-like chemotaxis protein
LKRLTENNIHQLVQKGDVGKEELLNHIHKMTGADNFSDRAPLKRAKPVEKEGRITILLVEDNEDNVKTIEVLLAEKFNLIVARDGVEGVDKAKDLNPDLILLDISLPRKDGFMVLEEIREVKHLQDVPVIAVTARAMKGDKEHFLKYGFDDYVSKPVNSDLFEETLRKWILNLPRN